MSNVALNKRLFFKRRLQRKLDKQRVEKVAHSLWDSKLRYGLQLYAKVRTADDQTKPIIMQKLQRAQNKMLRVLENVKISDRISIAQLLERQKTLSVNQTQAQIKLSEIWKATNLENYPITVTKRANSLLAPETRSLRNERLVTIGTKRVVLDSCVEDAKIIWNLASENIKQAKTLYSAKTLIKQYCATLPI